MKKIFGWLCLLIIFAQLQGKQLPKPGKTAPEKKIVVVIPSYNNSAWYTKKIWIRFFSNIMRIFVLFILMIAQMTIQLISKRLCYYKKFTDRCTVIKNTKRVGALLNLYRAVHSCDDCEIIVTLDGDDWFKHPDVLQVVNTAYSDPNVWLTYGQYENYPNGVQACVKITRNISCKIIYIASMTGLHRI